MLNKLKKQNTLYDVEMDLHSLPEEMLASILKYNDYPTIHKLKHMDSHINRVAKSHNIGSRLPVTRLRFRGDDVDDSETTWLAGFDISEETWKTNQVLPEGLNYEFGCTKNDGSHIDLVDKLLDRIEEVSEQMSFHFAPIDDEFLTVFLKNIKRIRKLKAICIEHTDVACSTTMAKRLISSLKKLNRLSICNSTTSIDGFCHTEVLEGRKWNRIEFSNNSWDYPFTHKGLNDEFLLKVVKNCNVFVAEFKMYCMFFTVNGVVELIKALIEEEKTPESILLSSVICDDPTFETAKNKLEALNVVQCNFKTNGVRDGLVRRCRCEVYFPKNQYKAAVTFTTRHPA